MYVRMCMHACVCVCLVARPQLGGKGGIPCVHTVDCWFDAHILRWTEPGPSGTTGWKHLHRQGLQVMDRRSCICFTPCYHSVLIATTYIYVCLCYYFVVFHSVLVCMILYNTVYLE